MKPNIDRRGRIVRGISGLACLAAGVWLILAGWAASDTLRWAVVVALILVGGFQLFEARKSWCIVRACGIRTPL